MSKICKKFGVIVLMIALASACATTIKGRSDYNPAVNFADYHTFSWIGDSPLISAPSGMNPINVQRIMDEIRHDLTAKGYRFVHDQTEADFVVSFTIGTRDKINIDSYPAAYGGYWGWGGRYYGGTGMMATDVETYTEGVLAIDIFDVATHQPAWHGWAAEPITNSVRENPSPVIAEAVAAILSNFPPQQAGS
ncbi:DUF4136 domain-containing protein [Nitrosococcus watsonii]|uniref:Putative lipoprotein n=1 Tax=Nitrosococcus watsoni (strain C-113) TaxID=105559 RepID=D8K492_NITWC|nr:DUF4136 domain-containing protein [Nitrosococcus watsonii]ADJ27789.1 putative lipoprotein [Nitrosococcus watsonii C-113]